MVIFKKIISFLFFLCFFTPMAYSQPKSLNYEDEPKTEDFFLDILSNPNTNLYEFLICGLNSHNTDLKELYIYQRDTWTQNKCKELNTTVEEAYKKVKACWKVFKEIENTDISYNGFGKYVMKYHRDNITAKQIQDNCPNKRLQHQLWIVPLRLEKY